MANIEKIDVITEEKGAEQAFGKVEKGAAAAAKKLDQLQEAQFRAELAGRSHSEKAELLRGKLATLDSQTVKYANTLGKLRTEQAAVGREAERMAAQQAAAATKLANEQKRSISSLLAVAGIGFSVYGLKTLVTDVAKGTYALGQLGAQSITVRDSFAYMTQSVGMNAGMLKQLQVAAGGTINSMKLMELSNMALVGLGPQVGNALASQEARLIEISRAALKANPAIGSVEFAYNSLVLGVKRLEKRLVDNIGLQVKVNDANSEYAASIGKTVDQLSAEDKQMAMLNAILKGGSRLIQQVGGDVNTMNDSFLRATTSVQEFKIALGEALAVPVSGFAETVSAELNLLSSALTDDLIANTKAALLLAQKDLETAQKSASNMERGKDKGLFIGAFFNATAQSDLKYAQERVKELTEQLRILKSVSESGIMTKQEEEARRLVGVTLESAYAMTKQELEARGLARGIDVASSSVRRLRGNLLDLNGVTPVIANSLARLAGVARALIADFSGTALLGFTDVMSIEEYSSKTKDLANYEKALEVQVALGNLTRQEADYQLRKYTDKLTDHYGALQKTTTATEKLTDAERELQSAIASAVEPSFTVDDLAPDLVVREDAVDEHYRRLAAIALRGQEEIDKHNVDWADTIAEIPADIRAKGIEAMQAWAKEKVVAYGKGLDTSLVNRERIKALVMEQIQANKMRDELVNEIYAEMGGTVALRDVQAAAGDVTGTGSAMGQAISTGVKDSIDVDGMLKTTASAINAGAKTYAQQLKTSGGSVGGIILDGITTAVTDGAPDIVKKLAESLAPSVAKILENNARRSGQ